MCCGSVQPIVILEATLWRSFGRFREWICIKTAYVLGGELWEYDFDNLLSLVKEYVVGVGDARE